MNNTEYKELTEKLNNLEAIAYGYNINGEVLGMDCSDFEQIMVDSAVAITELMEILAKVTAERDELIRDMKILGSGCYSCKHFDRSKGKCRAEEPCGVNNNWEWKGVQEVQEDE